MRVMIKCARSSLILLVLLASSTAGDPCGISAGAAAAGQLPQQRPAPTTPSGSPQPQWPTAALAEGDPCTGAAAEKIDVSGAYCGVFYRGKGAEGVKARLVIRSDGRFEIIEVEKCGTEAGRMAETGRLAVVETCNRTVLRMAFDRLEAQPTGTFVQPVASLWARQAGSSERYNFETLKSERPIILEAFSNSRGQPVGLDLAFVVCPKPPYCCKLSDCECDCNKAVK